MMAPFDSRLHRRRSIRLRGYDYSLTGGYFVTLCTWQRECLFGEVVEGEVWLSELGEIADEEWLRLGKRFPWADFSSYVVMPNHVHGIVVIHGENRRGAGLDLDARCGGQTPRPYEAGSSGRGAGLDSDAGYGGQTLRPYEAGNSGRGAGLDSDARCGGQIPRPYEGGNSGRGAGLDSDAGYGGQTLRPYNNPGNEAGGGPDDGPRVVPGSLGAIVRSYKATVTWRIHALDDYTRVPVWQRNYYDHIIRNKTELQKIWDYIDTNPDKWITDQLHPSASPNRFNQE